MPRRSTRNGSRESVDGYHEHRYEPRKRGKRDEGLSLTSHNLQALLDSSPRVGERRNGSVALDMDRYMDEQRHMAHSNSIDVSDVGSVNSLEFGESNPSSEHSSDTTSLDDVCFPDYEGDTLKKHRWPDLQVLEEFITEEINELQPQVTFSGSVNFGERGNERERNERENEREGKRERNERERERQERWRQQNSKETESTGTFSGILNRTERSISPHERMPLLNYQVNETETESLQSLQVRPEPIQPWEKSREQIPTILRSKRRDTCRFTYFREDLDNTIHAATLSGLIGTDERKEERREERKERRKERVQDRKDSRTEQDRRKEQDRKDRTHRQDSRTHKLEQNGKTEYTHGLREDSEDRGRERERESERREGDGESKEGDRESERKEGDSEDRKMGAREKNPTLQPLTKLDRIRKHSPIYTKLQGLFQPGASRSPSAHSLEGSPPENSTPFWLDVLDPTEEEMKVISKTFGVHPLTTEDIFLGETREKVELFSQYYFICFTSFDVVYERRKQRAREHERKTNKLQEMAGDERGGVFGFVRRFVHKPRRGTRESASFVHSRASSSGSSRRNRVREGELQPLNMYMLVFKHAVITFHFSPTPHPINVRRRARLLRDYLTVSSDWLCYALVDDITDSFAPMIASIEDEVNAIEDEILKMHSGDVDSDAEADSDDDEPVFFRRPRSKSTVEHHGFRVAPSSASSRSSKSASHIISWKRKGDMLRRIGECRKRVMSILRLLGTKADVIKAFGKRFSEGINGKSEIAMYLGDIQDHIVTMVQSLNHYEKLLARFHSNYLAQINIDMTKVNNDTNDVLGKITILGTIVLPINVVTGLWGMNCIVPGQDYDGLAWFYGIVLSMCVFSVVAYNYARRVTGL